MEEYFEANRANWNDRAAIHADSKSYDLDAYVSDPARLSGVVRWDRDRLGDLTGQTALHLQCHIGTDTLSLARLGATVTGLDQSDESLTIARQLFADTDTAGEFVESTVDGATAALDQTYDLVYTGVGALNWLPRVDRWAETVAALLTPGGRLYLREGHPILWAIDDEADPADGLKLRYPYFEQPEPMAFDMDQTYTDGDGRMEHSRMYEWNHGIGEIITAVLDHGLVLDAFEEHRELEWMGLAHMIDAGGGRSKLPATQSELIPLMYTLVAHKPG